MKIRGWAALGAVGAIVLLSQAFAGAGAELLNTRITKFFLIETVEGRAIAERLGGIEKLEAALASPRNEVFSRTLEKRLSRMNAEVEAKVPPRQRGGARSLSKIEEAYVLEIAPQLFALEECGSRCLKFAEGPRNGFDYAASREIFLAGSKSAAPRFLKEAFPKTIWRGPLESRAQSFVEQWSSVAAWVDDVRFAYKPETGRTEWARRRVLVIASDTPSLGVEGKDQLVRDFTNAMAGGTISFPIGEGGGHLYTRVGTKTLDFLGDEPGVNAYVGPGSRRERIEIMVSLSPAEESRVVRYLDNAISNPDRTLGEFIYEGAAGRTNGKLTDNRPVAKGKGHNCTSWMCTAPVGDNGEPLYKLVGAAARDEVHTNPGWWNSFLAGAAEEERIPFIVMWVPAKDLKSAMASVRSSAAHWDFSTH